MIFYKYHTVFTTSINSGLIPQEWKIHKIVPVLKSGDKTSTKNYRVISLLCIISKVLERLIYNKVVNKIVPLITPGFQSNTSTLQQLLIYFHQLTTSKAEIHSIYIYGI